MQSSTEFAGTPRFRVVRKLGAGGFGVVYEALDRDRGMRVALKTLPHHSPAGLLLLKHEFRVLADLSHGNLVALYELFADDARVFFTMERIDGVDLLTALRGGSRPQPQTGVQPVRGHTRARSGPLTDAQIESVRDAFGQLAQGVATLHSAGKLHRDLKPPNVLRERGGRVVLLDFGLVLDRAPTAAAAEEEDDAVFVGTPDYSAPERLNGNAATQAADWYAVGVMLFEALTGALPQETISPAALEPTTPPALDALCASLLARDPAQRPRGRSVLSTLLGKTAAWEGSSVESEQRHPGDESEQDALRALPLVGRARELAWLRSVASEVRPGGAVIAEVRGPSGAGKSALLRAFAREWGDARDALVLDGRCYERESLPFKGVDGVIDALALALAGWPDREVREVLPPKVSALTRSFPVLRRVYAIDEAIDRENAGSREGSDAPAARREAVAALAALLGSVAARKRVLVLIDDAQWADPDGRSVLGEVLACEPQPPVFFVLASRPAGHNEAPEPSSWLPSSLGSKLTSKRLDLKPLAPHDATELACAALRARPVSGAPSPLAEGPELRALAARLVLEAGGNAFFLLELARHSAGGERSGPREPGTSLRALVRSRLDALAPDARALLDVVCASAGPVSQRVAYSAAALGRVDPRPMTALRAAGLVRTDAAGPDATVEPAHDRVREETVDALDAGARVALHGRIADALESFGSASPATLATHLYAAGRSERAAHFALAAAREAERSFAFDRAARWYRVALDTTAGSTGDRVALRSALAQALADQGRCGDSAEQFLAAALKASPEQAHALRRRAAEQWLLQGQFDRGIEIMGTVLRDLGLRMPATRAEATWQISRELVRTLRLVSRALSDEPDETSPPVADPERDARLEAYHAASVGTALFDSVLSVAFHVHYVRLALETRDPAQRALGLVRWSTLETVAGESGRARAARIIQRAERIVREHHRPDLEPFVHYAWGIWHTASGSYVSGERELTRTIEQLRGAPSSHRHDIDSMETFRAELLFRLGRLTEWRARVRDLSDEAVHRGYLFGEVFSLVRREPIVALLDDAPDAALARVDLGLSKWRRPPGGPLLQLDLLALSSRTLAHLYAGSFERAHEEFERALPGFERAGFLRVQLLRVDTVFERGRCAVGAATVATRRQRGRLLALARKCEESLRGERTVLAVVWAQLLDACIARVQGDGDAGERFFLAARALENAGLRGHALAARWRGAELFARDPAMTALREEIAARFRADSVRDPAGWVRTLTPVAG